MGDRWKCIRRAGQFHVAATLIAATAFVSAADEPKPPGRGGAPESKAAVAQGPPAYQRPDLVAITWRPPLQAKIETSPIVWRPDGSLLDAEEIAWLQKSLHHFERTNWNADSEIRPLALVFRIDERATASQYVMPILLHEGRLLQGASAQYTNALHLAASGLSPNVDQLAEWPAEIDIQVRTQIAEPELLHRFDKAPDPPFIPEAPLNVDKGVQWYVHSKKGRRVGQLGYPAAVLQVSRTEADPLNEYSTVVRLKNGQELKGKLHRQTREYTEHVSPPIEDHEAIASVEFWRRRYRIDTYEKVPTKRELMPK